MLKVLVMVSGGGTNLQAIIDSVENGTITNTKIVGVISNNQNAYALERAGKHGISAECISPKNFENRAVFNEKLLERVNSYEPDLIVLAGFLVVIPPEMIAAYRNRMINIHPSLLPSFRGLHTHQQAIDAGVRVHGATVHFVTPELDGGPIIAQAIVPVFPDDNEDKLADRVLEQEHRIYPRVVRLIVEDRISLNEDGRVNLSPEVVDSLGFIVKGGGL